MIRMVSLPPATAPAPGPPDRAAIGGSMHMRFLNRLASLAVATLALSSVAGPATAAPPSGEIRDAGGPTAVAGSYIVVLKDAAVPRSQVPARARSLAATHQGAIGYVYTSAVRGFSVRMDESQARRL